MIKTFFQIILFIPFVIVFFVFAIFGRSIKRLETLDFLLKKPIIGILRSITLVGMLLVGYIGKVYE